MKKITELPVEESFLDEWPKLPTRKWDFEQGNPNLSETVMDKLVLEPTPEHIIQSVDTFNKIYDDQEKEDHPLKPKTVTIKK